MAYGVLKVIQMMNTTGEEKVVIHQSRVLYKIQKLEKEDDPARLES